MGDIVRSVHTLLSDAQARTDIAAQNIANMSTVGYRARSSFAELSAAGVLSVHARPSLAVGALAQTGAPFDLAIEGEGFFELRGAGGPLYTRDGRFSRAQDGRLLGLDGLALQAVGGGDLVAPEAGSVVDPDGTLRVGGEAVARVRVVALDVSEMVEAGSGLFRTNGRVEDVAAPVVRQGFVEGSNVTLGQEMVVLMAALRRAEAGQRVMNVYDDLLGRAVTTFGAAGA